MRLSWAVRIERAELAGKFTDNAKIAACDDWHTCAVGEKHNWEKAWGQSGDYREWSKSLEATLGYEFAGAVKNDDVPTAKCLYAEIMALP